MNKLDGTPHEPSNAHLIPGVAFAPDASSRIRRAVRRGVRDWSASRSAIHPLVGQEHLQPNGNNWRRSLPRRRKFKIVMDRYAGPPMMRKLVFKVKYRQAVWRLFVFSAAMLRWYAGRFKDRLRGTASDETRARRLREIIQRLGGTAIKIGQQLAMRVDLMPYAYGVELSKLFDEVPAFPTEQAIERIEALLGPIDKTFAAFDPEPIGHASVACVYQAVLKNGERVAIKVRRPGIGELFVADCKALTWVLQLMEFATLLRPGLTRNLLFEFENMLIEELDFVKEARYTELFRRRVLKKLHHVTAPRVYFDLSGDDVLTTEYVEGLWLGEMIAGIEQKNPEVLAYMRAHNLDPKLIARRLIRTNQFGIFENLLFHADPHPSNVVLQPNSKLVFIDFGSCGAYTTRERNNWRQLAYYQSKEDIGRMVQCALAVLEPLPAIDIDEFGKKLEAVFWRDLYAFKSHHSEWWERTSARTWMSFLSLASEFQIPMNLNTLRMIRSTLLYETVAARLFNGIDAYREHRKYNRTAGKRARKRVNQFVSKRLLGGPTDTDYLRIEQLMQMGNRAVYLAQRALDTPPFRYGLLISKAAYALIQLFKEVRFVAVSSAVLFAAVALYRLVFTGDGWAQINFYNIVSDIYRTKLYLIVVVVVLWLNVRRIRFRLTDKELHRRNTSGLS